MTVHGRDLGHFPPDEGGRFVLDGKKSHIDWDGQVSDRESRVRLTDVRTSAESVGFHPFYRVSTTPTVGSIHTHGLWGRRGPHLSTFWSGPKGKSLCRWTVPSVDRVQGGFSPSVRVPFWFLCLRNSFVWTRVVLVVLLFGMERVPSPPLPVPPLLLSSGPLYSVVVIRGVRTDGTWVTNGTSLFLFRIDYIPGPTEVK